MLENNEMYKKENLVLILENWLSLVRQALSQLM